MSKQNNLLRKLNHRNWAIVVEGRINTWYVSISGAIRLFSTRHTARLAKRALGPYCSGKQLKVVRVSVMELEWRCKSGVRRRKA